MQSYYNHLEQVADYYCYPMIVVFAMVEYSNYSTIAMVVVPIQ
jgi:hypothetical protein